MLSRRRVLVVATETTPGTPATLNPTNAIYVLDAKSEPTVEFNQRQDDATLGHRTGVIGARRGKATFKVELKGSGTAATSPSWAEQLLPACGMIEGTASNTGVWNPTSVTGNYKTLTIGLYEDGILKTISGAMGTWSFEGEAGKVTSMSFEFEGLWQPPVDAAMPSPQADTIKPPKFQGATCTLGGALAPLSKASLQQGNKVEVRQDVTNVTGYCSALVTDRDYTGKLDPEQVNVATRDVFGQFLSGTEQALSLVIGTTAGNIMTFTAPAAQTKTITEGSRNNLVTTELDFELNKVTGDDELVLSFT